MLSLCCNTNIRAVSWHHCSAVEISTFCHFTEVPSFSSTFPQLLNKTKKTPSLMKHTTAFGMFLVLKEIRILFTQLYSDLRSQRREPEHLDTSVSLENIVLWSRNLSTSTGKNNILVTKNTYMLPHYKHVCFFLTGKWNPSGMNIIAFATYFHFPVTLHFPTCKVVLWSEKGELKKVVTILITISVTYFSNMESACFLSLVLLQACKDNLFLGQKQLSHGRSISVMDWNSWFHTVSVTAIPWQNDIYDTRISGFPAYTKAEAQQSYCFNVLAYSMFRREGKKTRVP